MTDKPIEGQIELPGLASWYGKTSRALSQAPEATEKARTSAPSSKRSSKLSDRTRPVFLYLTADAGQSLGLSWAEAPTESLFPLLTDYTTPSFGESPSEENASRLSSILEASPLPKYCLSAKACEGILNRAKKRGKTLPEALALALKAQSAFKSAPENPGGGKGILIQEEHVGALSTFNNQSVFCLNTDNRVLGVDVYNNAITGDVTFPIGSAASDSHHVPSVFCIEGHVVDRDTAQHGLGVKQNVAQTLNATDRHAVFYDAYQYHNWRPNDTSGPLTAGQNGGIRGDTPLITVLNDQGGGVMSISEDKTATLRAQEHGHAPLVFGLCDYGSFAPSVSPLRTRGGDYGGGSENLVCSSAVRRLTPMECERLQGFPDGWTDIGAWTDTRGRLHKESSDAARYKALGNSIALPFWFWLLRRISALYERPATLGSLFDGIGGFPLCWERCNGPGTARWASEIEEFPIAVTKGHFPEAAP